MTAEAKQTTFTSRVGKRPVVLPKGVSATVGAGNVGVKGPKGNLSCKIAKQVDVAVADGTVVVTSTALGRDGSRLQGLVRALVQNMVLGVTEGYEKRLELHGTGYRGELKGRTLTCSLGFSHPVVFELPAGISVEIPKDSKGSLLIIRGADKGLVGQTAASIRAARPPEPYGGKGVRYKGERVREKAGKAGK